MGKIIRFTRNSTELTKLSRWLSHTKTANPLVVVQLKNTRRTQWKSKGCIPHLKAEAKVLPAGSYMSWKGGHLNCLMKSASWKREKGNQKLLGFIKRTDTN